VLCCHQSAAQNLNVMAANKSFDNVKKFEYLRTTQTDQDYIHEKNEEQIKLGQFLLPFVSETFVFLTPM
jgi:hypothetical protein